ncbi:MAG: hypothetical protein ACPGXZ_06060 [Saprospiraceae bacterium]
MNEQYHYDVVLRTVNLLGLTRNPHRIGKEELDKAKEVERKEIKPHYDGTMPDYLEKAYPGESPEIQAYRKANYAAITQPLIYKAISSLYRFFAKSQFRIEILNEDMRAYINNKKFDGKHLNDFHLDKGFTNKALDPNSVCVVLPKGNAPTSNNQVIEDVEIRLIGSEHIVLESPFLEFKAVNGEFVTIDGVEYEVEAYIADTEHYSILGKPKGNADAPKWKHWYSHRLGRLPYFVVGSDERYITDVHGGKHRYFISDFKAAMPALRRAVSYENNFFGVSMKMGSPKEQSFEKDCTPCRGTGLKTNIKDGKEVKEPCQTCSGKGKVPLTSSPFEGITMTNYDPDNEKMLEFLTKVKPVSYELAPYQNIDQMREWFKYYYEMAKDILNIDKIVKQAQSAVAKEADRQESSIEVEAIAEDWYKKLEQLYNIIQGLLFLDTENPVVVQIPADFNRKSEAELFEAFQRTINLQMPMDVRMNAYFDYIERRYPHDKIGQRLAKIKVTYAPFSLLSDAELRRPGHDNEKTKALFADAELFRIKHDKSMPINQMTDDDILKVLEERMKPRLVPSRLPDVEIEE